MALRAFYLLTTNLSPRHFCKSALTRASVSSRNGSSVPMDRFGMREFTFIFCGASVDRVRQAAVGAAAGGALGRATSEGMWVTLCASPLWDMAC